LCLCVYGNGYVLSTGIAAESNVVFVIFEANEFYLILFYEETTVFPSALTFFYEIFGYFGVNFAIRNLRSDSPIQLVYTI